jgi:hypothetical protein
MTALVAVDAVLVALFLVVLLLAVTGGLSSFVGSSAGEQSTGSSTGPSASTGTPSAETPATGQALEAFASPSGNIACTMSGDGVRCTIASITFTPPVDDACTGTIGHEVVLDASGVQVPCVDGPAPGVAADTVPVLDYGLTSSVGGYTCTSATDGVTCVQDASGTGFRLARAEYVVLP